MATPFRPGAFLAYSAVYLRSPMIHRRPLLFVLLLGLASTALAQPALNQKDAKGRKQGPWERTWAESKQLRYKGQFKDDKPVGTFTYYSTNGKVESIVDHYSGSDAAHARHFHPDGQLMAEGRYVGEHKDSTWNYYDTAKRLRRIERWKSGKLHDEQVAFFDNGTPAERSTYTDGKRTGTWTQYYDDGKPRTVTTYVNDVEDGPFTAYTAEGKKDREGKYVKGVQEGSWYEYNADGSILIEFLYKNGQLAKSKKENGTFKEYYPSEQPRSEYTYKNGKREGRFVEYFDNGHWVEKPTQLGPAGNAVSAPERVLEGQGIQREGTYKNDLLEGDVKEYDEKGRVLSVTRYAAGVAQTKSAP